MVRSSDARIDARVRELADGAAASLDFEVVELRLQRGGRRWTLRVDIDRVGPKGVDLEDCRKMSRDLERLLDDEDLIPASYDLEVSSPGIDRQIRSPDDVRRNVGRPVVVETSEPVQDRRKFEGILAGSEEGHLLVREVGADEPRRIPIASVASARQQLPF